MQIFRLLGVALMSIVLVACGGGGSLSKDDNSTGGGNTPTPITSLSIASVGAVSGANSTIVSNADPLTVQVTMTTDGVPQANQVVSFALDDAELVTLSSDNGSAKTDSQGVAEITLSVTNKKGAGTITAAIADGTQVQLGIESLGDAPILEGITLDIQGMNSVSNEAASVVSHAEPLALNVTVFNNNEPVENVVVSFNAGDSELVRFSSENGNANTNAEGIATIMVYATAKIGATTVTASLDDGTSTQFGIESLGGEPVDEGVKLNISGINIVTTESSNIVTNAEPLELQVMVMNNSEAVSDAVVSFSIDDAELVTFSTENARSITDETGLAKMRVFATAKSGAGTITASYEGVNVNFAVESVGDGLVITPPEPTLLSDFYWCGDNAIANSLEEVLACSKVNEVIGEETAYLVVRVIDRNTNQPINNASVEVKNDESVEFSFSLLNQNNFSFTQYANTDENGYVVLNIKTAVNGILTPEQHDILVEALGSTLTLTRPVVSLAERLSVSLLRCESDVETFWSSWTNESASPSDEVFSKCIFTSTLFKNDPNHYLLLAQVKRYRNNEGVSNVEVKPSTAMNSSVLKTNVDGLAFFELTDPALIDSSTFIVDTNVDFLAQSVSLQFLDYEADTPAKQVGVVELLANKQLLNSGLNDTVELTALVKDLNNVLISGQSVTFRTSSGEIQEVQSVTDETGKATAVLSTQNNPENRTLQVTAISNEKEQTIDIDVIGTTIDINGGTSAVIGDSFNITTVVKDAEERVLPNIPLVINSSNNNTLTSSSATSDSSGQISLTFTAVNSGTDSITVSGLSATGVMGINVQSDTFAFATGAFDALGLNTNHSLTINWQQDGVAVNNQNVSFTTTRGVVTAVATTNTSGNATVTISSSTAGPAIVSATATGADGQTITTLIELGFVAETVSQIEVQAAPASIGANGDTSTITAIVRDASGNLVKNKVIDFVLNDVSGGSIFPASDTTDAQGVASTVYTSNSTSASKGVGITATDRDSGLNDSISLTVADKELFFRFGTGSIITSENNDTSYLKEYIVFVTDADGNPVANKALTASLTPLPTVKGNTYFKGQWGKTFDDEGEFAQWVPLHAIGCLSEDVDVDGILDAGEDNNGDGEISPGNVATVSSALVSDDNGSALIQIRYPKSFGGWVSLDLTVSASVSGTETSSTQSIFLGVSGVDSANELVPPPSNPLGQGPSTLVTGPGDWSINNFGATCTSTD